MRNAIRVWSAVVEIQRRATAPIEEVHGFNVNARNRWVEGRAKTVPAGAAVLDIGAGTAPYRAAFAHCHYSTQDFGRYDGFKGPEGQYGKIDYVSDITSIPAPDSCFDVVLCTEVLEHVPYPIDALKEMVRLTKPGGRLFITAPLGSGLHQEPYHFYGGYTDHWYRKFLSEFGCEIVSIEPNHGFFAHLAQECARFGWTIDRHRNLHGRKAAALVTLISDKLSRYFYDLDGHAPIREFTVGFHVEARRL